MPPAATDSLSASVAPIAAGAHVTAACFLGDTPALALGDGTVLLGAEGERRVAAHPDGAVLCATADRDRIVTGGDDGRVVSTRPDGSTEELGAGKGWIDALALHATGAVAWATGRDVKARSAIRAR